MANGSAQFAKKNRRPAFDQFKCCERALRLESYVRPDRLPEQRGSSSDRASKAISSSQMAPTFEAALRTLQQFSCNERAARSKFERLSSCR
jgi:hypothetical protein